MKPCESHAALNSNRSGSNSQHRYGALRLVSVEQGYDPRDFSLVAFGGAGPLHACSLGKLLGAWPVIIPPSPGVLCALGEATTLLRHEIGRAFTRTLNQTSADEVVNGFYALLAQVKQVMRDEQGVAEEKQVRQFNCLGYNSYLSYWFDPSPVFLRPLSPVRQS